MAFDVGNQVDRDRLHTAIQSSRDAMNTWRDTRTGMLRQYVGSMYGLHGPKMTVYVNNLNRTANIYQMALAFNCPQVKITSFDQKLWPFCRKFEINVNKCISNIGLNLTLQECVLDAFFLMGICKVRMADAGEQEISPDVWVDPGKPWAEQISFDNSILDLSAGAPRKMRFFGDKYRAAISTIRNRDDFEHKVAMKVASSSKYTYDSGSNYASEIASGSRVDDDELEPMAWLEDVYVPQTKELITFSADNTSLAPLKVQKMDENDFGPQGNYEFLGFGIVPDNLFPSSPAQQLVALDLLMNRLYRKLSQQAQRQKNTVAYPPGGEDDAKRGMEAVDGAYWKCRDPKSLQPINFPGVDGNTNAFFLAAQEVYNTAAGNERAIGGLGQDAETLGQEEIVQGHAGGRIGYMKGQVNAFASNICRKLGHLMYDDEAMTIDSSMEVEGTGYRVDTSWRPGEREGKRDYYDFSVEPNSMAYSPPEAKVQKIFRYLAAVSPMLPMVQAGILDIQELTRLVAEYENIPEMEKIFNFMRDNGVESGSDPHQATKSPVTSREVVRRNVSQGPQGQGMANVLGQFMQGNKSQQVATVG